MKLLVYVFINSIVYISIENMNVLWFFTPNIKDKEEIGKNILMIHLVIHQMSKYDFNEFIHKSEFHMKTLN